MNDCNKYNRRYYYGEVYSTVNQIECIPGDACSGTPCLYYIKEVVDKAPDLFGEEHLLPRGIAAYSYTRIPIFTSPVILDKGDKAQVTLFHAGSLNMIFEFQGSDIRFKSISGVYDQNAKYKLVFKRLDGQQITESLINNIKSAKTIKVINHAL